GLNVEYRRLRAAVQPMLDFAASAGLDVTTLRLRTDSVLQLADSLRELEHRVRNESLKWTVQHPDLSRELLIRDLEASRQEIAAWVGERLQREPEIITGEAEQDTSATPVVPTQGPQAVKAEQDSSPKADVRTHGPDFRSVDWYGTPYTFTATQAACVKVLWE